MKRKSQASFRLRPLWLERHEESLCPCRRFGLRPISIAPETCLRSLCSLLDLEAAIQTRLSSPFGTFSLWPLVVCRSTLVAPILTYGQCSESLRSSTALDSIQLQRRFESYGGTSSLEKPRVHFTRVSLREIRGLHSERTWCVVLRLKPVKYVEDDGGVN